MCDGDDDDGDDDDGDDDDGDDDDDDDEEDDEQVRSSLLLPSSPSSLLDLVQTIPFPQQSRHYSFISVSSQ